MKRSEFYYDLPKELIAQEPLEKRDSSRLMVLDRKTKSVDLKVFSDLADYIKEGNCLVLNDTRVIPVRLYGRRKTGGKGEIFLLDTKGEKMEALIRPSKRIKPGEEIELENGTIATVTEDTEAGRFVQFDVPQEEALKGGHMPLPPYIDREDTSRDREDYQTVYAEKDGATASPTAGLHFTEKLLDGFTRKGVITAYVTLHTSYGTFSPVKAENIEEHQMHSEYYEISKETADMINKVKQSGNRVFAVGTTSTRVLETTANSDRRVLPSKGETNLFIYPGYKFKIIDGIVTNFHLPESTLLMLVSAFGGKEFIFEAYKKAIESKFRFFSYGDAMLIL